MYLQKLTELLCREEDIRKDIMELRFGSRLTYHRNGRDYTNTYLWKFRNRIQVRKTSWLDEWQIVSVSKKEVVSAINDLHLHHLLWFVKLRDERIDWWSTLIIESDWEIIYEWETVVTSYDVTKHLYQQSEKILEDICNFLTK